MSDRFSLFVLCFHLFVLLYEGKAVGEGFGIENMRSV